MAEQESSETTIIEERVELMIDPTTSNEAEQNPTKRTGYFLKPSLNLNELPPKLPKIQSFSSSSRPNVIFLCRSTPYKGWQTWVEKLRQTQEPAWRKAGIFDAINCSTYHIAKINDLIYSLVEKWCPETNTFVFPWGEATITLEDVFVLGGFSPLGVSVLSSSSDLGKDVEKVKNKLIMSCRKLKENGNNLSHLRWEEYFMGCADEIDQYAGFLCLWLVRHVFPGKNTSSISQAVFVMAARICCGAKLAFGPVVLASIYSELTLLKKEILSGGDDGSRLFVSSPLHLVQVWAWERFPLLGPVPRMMDCGEVRLARWESHARKLCDDIDDVKMCLDSARENFRWRPYGMSIENWSLPRFYVNSGMWVVLDSDEDEWKLFARCLMVGQLNGLDCVENYNPHRVALQFGFDQDIPKSSCYTLDEVGYRMDFEGLKMYLPPRLHEGDITSRYFDWWRKRFAQEEMALVGSKRKLRTRKRVKKIAKIFDRCDELKAIIVENVGMEEGDEGMLWNTNRSMDECSKLADIELHRGIDEEEGGMEVAENEMLRERKQGCAAIMTSLCSQSASKHHNLENEIGTLTECSGTLIRVASNDEPDTNHVNITVDDPVAASLPVMDKSDQKSFAARCVEYESRMSRLERMISATSVYKPT